MLQSLPVQPKFENVEGAFRVVLPNTHVQELSAENEKYLPILRLFETQEEITRSNMVEEWDEKYEGTWILVLVCVGDLCGKMYSL